MKKIHFPQYRRYKNGKSFFRIDSPESFEEIRALGDRWIVQEHIVRVHPDRVFLNDLLSHFQDFAEEIDSEAYFLARQKAQGS